MSAPARIERFGPLYDQLSREQRAAESERLRHEALVSPDRGSRARAAATQWRNRCRKLGVVRGREEQTATTMACEALARCTYLGGCQDYPNRAETRYVKALVHPSGSLTWFDRRDNDALRIGWSELINFGVVGAAGFPDRDGETQSHEAVLCVETTWGQAVLLVHGQTPLGLDAALSPLRACVGRAPSSELFASANIIDIDLQRDPVV